MPVHLRRSEAQLHDVLLNVSEGATRPFGPGHPKHPNEVCLLCM
jgi:hypothetical protein